MWQNQIYKYSLAKRFKFETLKKMFKLEKESRVLDIGSGNGIISKMLSKESDFVYSLEPNKIYFEESKKILNSSRVFNEKAEKIHFKGNFFNYVFLLDVLYYTNEKKTISECYRVLKKGGYLMVSFPYSNPTVNLKKLKRIMGLDLKHEGGIREDYNLEDISHLFLKKFKIVEKRYYNIFLVDFFESFIKWMRRKSKISSQTSVAESNIVNSKSFRFYKLIYPIIFAICKLDNLFEAIGFKGQGICIKMIKK
jgi:ubiquinone/menaquinone biosynthesis C-methylase UbiE